eukprot:COSAG06_NODE_16199_length_1014_cov_1.284153_2_plen_157_part_00
MSAQFLLTAPAILGGLDTTDIATKLRQMCKISIVDILDGNPLGPTAAKAFAEYDTDGSGCIDMNELLAGLADVLKAVASLVANYRKVRKEGAHKQFIRMSKMVSSDSKNKNMQAIRDQHPLLVKTWQQSLQKFGIENRFAKKTACEWPLPALHSVA